MTEIAPQYILPHWPAPTSVAAAISLRTGGISGGDFASNNLALHVGDNSASVEANRLQLTQALQLPRSPQWLTQVHGVKVVTAKTDGLVRTADAAITRENGLPCAILTADCLPVLLCDLAGTQIAAVHAGWRSLAKGIIQRTVAQFAAPGAELMAYFGPAISSRHFEVGIEVLEACFRHADNEQQVEAIEAAFRPSSRPLHFYADLYALARAA
ncbi:MAG TPA: laccase domain-containing protein, partial [Cellvibrionaceae bacterium]